jgi:hypothetical protein
MADGEQYSARLVVLSSGTGGNLQAQIGVRKKMVQDELSVAFGFVLSRPDGTTFPFDAVTYRPSSTRERVGYLTLFPDVVFDDDFESDVGWTTNPSGSDTATTGQWERANPAETTSGGAVMQLGTTVSGQNDLVTGPLAGSSAGTHDIDNGVTSIRSPNISLPNSSDIELSFYAYLAHLNNATTADFLRVSVVGSTTQVVFEELGSGDTDAAAWALNTADITAFAGQTIYLLVEAADASGGSLVEAGIDNVRITAAADGPTPTPSSTPTATNTPPPTNTPTPTNTPGPTSTPTNTAPPAPPPTKTATPTNTPGPTNNPPPTHTPPAVPGRSGAGLSPHSGSAG